MGLTSGAFLVLIIGIAVAGIAVTVWLWPRAAGRRIWHIGVRIGMVAVSEALVIVAFLVMLNGYFSFYASWSQLLGSGTTQLTGIAKAASAGGPLVTVVKAEPLPPPGKPMRTVPSLPAVAAGPKAIDLIGVNRAGGKQLAQTGELLGVTINGAHTGISETGNFVYLPPQYFQPAYAHARFPAVLALTGYPGSSWSIVKRLKLPGTATTLATAHKIRPAIYVMMNVSVAMPRDTECTNVPAGPQVETFFTQDVPEAIERTFRVQSGPEAWGVLGYSTGGFCAVKFAMMNPGEFSLAVSLAGYYTALEDDTTGNLYGTSDGYRSLNNPDWRLEHLPAPPVSVLVASSKIGEKTYPGTLKFLSLVRPPMRAYSLFLPQGGHNFTTWNRELPQSLEWLSARLQPAIPQTTTAPVTPRPSTSPKSQSKSKSKSKPTPRPSHSGSHHG